MGSPVGMRVPRQKEVVPGQDVVDVIIVSIDAKFGPLVSRVGLYDCLLARLLDGLLVETLSLERAEKQEHELLVEVDGGKCKAVM